MQRTAKNDAMMPSPMCTVSWSEQAKQEEDKILFDIKTKQNLILRLAIPLYNNCPYNSWCVCYYSHLIRSICKDPLQRPVMLLLAFGCIASYL